MSKRIERIIGAITIGISLAFITTTPWPTFDEIFGIESASTTRDLEALQRMRRKGGLRP